MSTLSFTNSVCLSATATLGVGSVPGMSGVLSSERISSNIVNTEGRPARLADGSTCFADTRLKEEVPRFPVTLCWRTVYREEMDAEYGNEVEAREQFDEWYHEVRCDWVKAIQRFVASRMVAGGILGGRGVSEIGVTALEGMGWKNWRGLEEKGPKCVQKWLEEADEIDGLRCPRLLKLFWKLAKHNAGR